MLSTNEAAAGPGNAYFLDVDGITWAMYHAWKPNSIGSVSPGRQVWLDPVTWGPGGPTIAGPDPNPQSKPMPEK